MPPEPVKKLEELEDASRCFQLTVTDKTATPCLQILNTLSQDALISFNKAPRSNPMLQIFTIFEIQAIQIWRYKRSKFGGTSEPPPYPARPCELTLDHFGAQDL